MTLRYTEQPVRVGVECEQYVWSHLERLDHDPSMTCYSQSVVSRKHCITDFMYAQSAQWMYVKCTCEVITSLILILGFKVFRKMKTIGNFQISWKFLFRKFSMVPIPILKKFALVILKKN